MALPQIIRELLENGVHFGHLSKHWNPRMKKFIFGKKKNVYIIDLEKTAEKLVEAKDFIQQLVQQGGKILFVATKKQVRELMKEKASVCGMPYVVERWVGGFLTNFSTIRTRVNRYKAFLEEREKGTFDKMNKKEETRRRRLIEKMDKLYSGVIELDVLPDCIFIVDPKREVACVREANKLDIPIIALIDTDANPEVIDYPVPGNDDAMKSVNYIVSHIAEAIAQGSKKRQEVIEQSKGEDDSTKESAREKVLEEAPKEDEPDKKIKKKKTSHPKSPEEDVS